MNESPIRAIAKIWREDADFRAEVETDPKAALASRGLEIDGPADVRVVADTEDTVHFVFPSDPDAALPESALDGVAGGANGRPGGVDNSGVYYPTYGTYYTPG